MVCQAAGSLVATPSCHLQLNESWSVQLPPSKHLRALVFFCWKEGSLVGAVLGARSSHATELLLGLGCGGVLCVCVAFSLSATVQFIFYPTDEHLLVLVPCMKGFIAKILEKLRGKVGTRNSKPTLISLLLDNQCQCLNFFVLF